MKAAEEQEYCEMGIDIVSAKERFLGNLDLYEGFLEKFLNYDCYERLCFALENQDVQAAFHEAHSLKSICGNLSFVSLYQEVTELTEALRKKDLEQVHALWPAFQTDYQCMKNQVELHILKKTTS